MGGNFKFAITILFHNTTPHTPYACWCFAASFLNKTRRYLSKKTLGGKCGYKIIKGEAGDIRIFRFPWFAPM